MHEAELLRTYAHSGSEQAFGEIVRAFLPLVYGSALRRVGGDVHRAEDVTQMVFVALAREAARLVRHPDLTGWLFTTTRFIAAKTVRTERRRQLREQAVFAGGSGADEPSELPSELSGVLDDVLAELSAVDRQILLLRFYRDLRHGQIAAELNSSENAVQKRITRALDHLRGLLSRRGITSTAAALAFALEQQTAVALPAGLAATTTAAAVSGHAGLGTTLAAPVLVSGSKVPLYVLAAVAVAGSAGVGWLIAENRRLRQHPLPSPRVVATPRPLAQSAPLLATPTPAVVPPPVAQTEPVALPPQPPLPPSNLLAPPPRAMATGRSPAPDDGQLVPLQVEYPEPLFSGTPRPVALPNLETAGRALLGLQVPVRTVLLSRGKLVTSSDTLPVIGELLFVTDGDKTGLDGCYVELGPSLQWIQIDLGDSAYVDAIALWHFHQRARVYHDVVVQVSDDPAFRRGVGTIFNNDHDNSSRLGPGRDFAYVETNRGRLIDGRGAVGRYVRLYSNGNTSDGLNHYCEVEVFGRWEEPGPSRQ
jgi:RNA polymerase sigma factor (sigma-70 family)